MSKRYLSIGLAAVLALAACSDEQNPDVCCTAKTDCDAVGLPGPTACEGDKLCRANQCIVELCSDGFQCDVAAPYCTPDTQVCEATCSTDAECPGFGQPADDHFCVGGACVVCRAGGDDCAGAAPVCDSGACRACAANAECASGVCADDGACAAGSEIAYVAPGGEPASDCSALSPCTLVRGLAVAPSRPYIVLATGSYALASTLVVGGHRRLVGTAGARPAITNLSTGPVFQIDANSDVRFESLEIGHAASATGGVYGDGIQCQNSGLGTDAVALVDTVLVGNARHGARAAACKLTATASAFRDNGQSGLDSQDGDVVVDRCELTGNRADGLTLDGGVLAVANSVIARNTGAGIQFYTQSDATHFDFNTIVDNAGGGVAGGPNSGASFFVSNANNIIARNHPNTACVMCTFTGSIVVGTDLSMLHFRSPDTAPFDYHLGAGSIAIDGATTTTNDHDIDGEPRPRGAASDVGADEAQ